MDLTRIPTQDPNPLAATPGVQQADGQQPFVYNGSQTCPGCGCVMSPIEVMYGYGLCPTCQSKKNARIVRSMLTDQATTERTLA